MNSSIKWRPTWKLWIPLLLFLIPLILEDQLIGTILTPYLYSVLLIVYGIIYFIRTRLWQAFTIATATALATSVYFLAERPGQTAESFQQAGIPVGEGFQIMLEQYITTPVWFVFLVLCFLSYVTNGPVFTRALELESAAIKLFKLCARQHITENNGYTERPFSAGKHNYNSNQLFSFATYLENKKICVAEFPDKGVKLKFSMGISPLNKKVTAKVSYVAFEENGTVTVFISQSDYRQYRRQYTFDQLCERMGNIFLRFAEYHVNHFESRIITEMKSV